MKLINFLLGGILATVAFAAVASCEHGEIPTLTMPQKATIVAINTASYNLDGTSPSMVRIHYYPGAGNFVAQTVSTMCNSPLVIEAGSIGEKVPATLLLSEGYASDKSGKFGYRVIGDQIFAKYGKTRILLVQINRS